MGKAGKKKKGPLLAEKIDARRKQYGNQRLKRAIHSFFASCDEDNSGFLEAHEFVIAQTAIAEMAGDAFDDEAAGHMFDDVGKFDKSGDSLVSPEEFEQTMLELCEVIPRNADEIVNELASKAAMVTMQMRRQVVMELRKFFKALDSDHSGYLEPNELDFMLNIVMDVARQQLGEQCEDFLTLEKFDKSNDGKVELAEFVDHLLDYTKRAKVPKRDILAKLKEHAEQAATTERPA